MSDDERRYTLNEAATELRRKECAVHGHSWDVIETPAGPVAIVCSTCGEKHAVVKDAIR